MKKKASILVVDDEKNITESLNDILSDEGYIVDTTESGDEALNILQQHPYDLVLLDIWLPGRKDGLQTLREIKKRATNSEVIMMSGHGSIDTAVRATKMGAADFFEKPFSLETVLESIKSVLKSRKRRRNSAGEAAGFKFIAESEGMKNIFNSMRELSKSNEPIALTGEVGTGKEYSATFIHKKSLKESSPFIKVNCKNMNQAAFDRIFGELTSDFKNKKSAFSKLEGTIYLDNPQKLTNKQQERLAELIPASQGRKTKKIRFIAGIQTSLEDPKPKGLSKSLKTLLMKNCISIPPLRERECDIELFFNYFFEHAQEDFGKPELDISDKAMRRILSYSWIGNLLEMQTVIENMVMACTSERIEPSHIPFGGALTTETTVSARKNMEKPKSELSSSSTAVVQKTMRQSFVLTGLGLHSGKKSGLIVSPLPPNSGIIFSDITTGKQVVAGIENVESTEYATTLKFGQTSVKTIEHIMAALHMYGITNALLKVDDEVPIMDGSAAMFCELIENAGIVEQDGFIEPIRFHAPLIIGENKEDEKYLLIEPSDRLEVEYRMDYPQPVGKIRAKYEKDGAESFKNEIAPARTFGFIKDIKQFEGKGLAEGGKLTNVILIDDEKVINTTLRFEDEFARHKILDILGDFYLLGRPVVGKITANLSGHAFNILMVRKIMEELNSSDSQQ